MLLETGYLGYTFIEEFIKYPVIIMELMFTYQINSHIKVFKYDT